MSWSETKPLPLNFKDILLDVWGTEKIQEVEDKNDSWNAPNFAESNLKI